MNVLRVSVPLSTLKRYLSSVEPDSDGDGCKMLSSSQNEVIVSVSTEVVMVSISAVCVTGWRTIKWLSCIEKLKEFRA